MLQDYRGAGPSEDCMGFYLDKKRGERCEIKTTASKKRFGRGIDLEKEFIFFK